MQGPMAAAIRERTAPNSSIARSVDSMTPASAPFHPAWAAPITLARESANSTGAQSAVSTPNAIPGMFVAIPSACGGDPIPTRCDRDRLGAVDLIERHEVLCTERGLHARAIGDAPRRARRPSPVRN
jgi:hypothetical protein